VVVVGDTVVVGTRVVVVLGGTVEVPVIVVAVAGGVVAVVPLRAGEVAGDRVVVVVAVCPVVGVLEGAGLVVAGSRVPCPVRCQVAGSGNSDRAVSRARSWRQRC
jgi:hypothetical protein